MNAHVKLEITGERRQALVALISDLDKDFPYNPATVLPTVCADCGGFVWRMPRLLPEDLRKAAKQIEIATSTPLECKVRLWIKDSTCERKHPPQGVVMHEV